MNTTLMFSSKSDEWTTPQDFFDWLDEEFEFEVDLAATRENAQCDRFITPEVDALTRDWHDYGDCGWLNPPYSRGLCAKFIAKAADESEKGFLTVMLLPARTDTRAFHRYILPFSGLGSASHELAYAAGVIDGEGCIGVYETKHTATVCAYLRLTVVNTDQAMLSRIHKALGVGRIRVSHEASGNRRTTYVLEALSGDASRALTLVYPFLGTKKFQAYHGLKFYHAGKQPGADVRSCIDLMSKAKSVGEQAAPGVEIRFIRGRLKFGGCKDAAPFPSMVVVFRP